MVMPSYTWRLGLHAFDLDASGHDTMSGGYEINVLDYGAVEDFSTDNATAFAAAVADMVDGCTLVFPTTTGLGYKTSATISITNAGCLIKGTGSEYGTRVHITASNTTLLSVIPSGLDGSRNQTNLIRGLMLTGPGGTGSISGSGVYASSDVHLENVGVSGFYNGLYWDNVTFYSRAYGCFFSKCARAIVLSGTNNCTIDTCRITGDPLSIGGIMGAVTDGIILDTALSRGLVNRIQNTSVEYFAGDGIRWNGGAGGSLVDCYFETQQSSSGHAHIRLGESNDTQALLIHGNYFQGDGTSGFDAIKAVTTTGIFLGPNRYGINGSIGVEASGGGNGAWIVAPQTGDTSSAYPTGSIILANQMSNPMTTSGDIIKGGASGAAARLAIGSSGQVLTVSGGAPVWATPSDDIPKSLVDAKGDLIAGTANDTVARVAVGTDGQFLKADSGASAGVSWATPAAQGVGAILVSDTPAGSPLVFSDLIQNEAGTDLVYADN